MKFSICLAIAALTISAGAYAQTAQTFRFGEGQSSLPSGHAQSTPAPRAQAQEAPGANARPKHQAKHHSRHRGHVPQPDTYSHS